ncbi:hypothetical protein TrVE_jg5323 [Triparma verrucosa]|uniref:Calponin-homology (CH) domain-containing protein n=1 Tax=Triparma verrucosa TaxID=1606542 RepID=A0A9W7BCN3_9STRA|nr:hypothetical protein TrVE_jg5323 [Triparma verrucosa]
MPHPLLSKSLKIATSKIREADRASRAGVSVGNTRQLIEWVNSFLGLIPRRKNEPVADPKNVGLSKLNDFGNGNTACQILDACTYGEVVKMERVRFGLSLTDSEKLSNWKEFQRSLDKLKISKSIDVNRLAAGLATDNLDLLKYLKALWNSMDNMEDYDPEERRGHAKGSLNSKNVKKKGGRQGGYAAANSNERAAIAAAKRAKQYNAKQQQQHSDASYASDSDYSRDSSVASGARRRGKPRKGAAAPSSGSEMEDTVLRREEERRLKLEAKKKKLLEMKKLQDEARAVKEEKEKIKQERIQLKREEAEKVKLEKARVKEERRIEREKKIKEKENVEAESLSDITISPRPSPTKKSAKKQKKKKPKKKKAEAEEEEEEELMVTGDDQGVAASANKPHNHRWRDNHIPPPQIRQQVPAPAPAPAPAPSSTQFLSSVQQRFQEKQLELSKPTAPTFHPPRLSATNTKLTAMQQLMACHPKIPSDCLMQRELNVVGLQGLMNDLIDSDPQADVSDLVLIFEEENAKLNKLKNNSHENDGSNTARVKAVKSYYYGYHGQLMAGNIDKLSRLDVKRDVWMEEEEEKGKKKGPGEAVAPKNQVTPVKAAEKKSKLLQPGWATKKVEEVERVEDELPDLSPQSNANVMSQMFQMPQFNIPPGNMNLAAAAANSGGQPQAQQFFPPPQFFMAQMQMYQQMMEQQQKQMAEGSNTEATEEKKRSPRPSPTRRPRPPEQKQPVSEKSSRSHGPRRRQQQQQLEEEEFDDYDDEATQHSRNSRNTRDTRDTRRSGKSERVKGGGGYASQQQQQQQQRSHAHAPQTKESSRSPLRNVGNARNRSPRPDERHHTQSFEEEEKLKKSLRRLDGELKKGGYGAKHAEKQLHGSQMQARQQRQQRHQKEQQRKAPPKQRRVYEDNDDEAYMQQIDEYQQQGRMPSKKEQEAAMFDHYESNYQKKAKRRGY